MKKNIVLTGMPGAGKSTMGVVLAKVLGMDFLDSDLVIQKTEGRKLCQIIEEDGIDGFLAVENRVNAGIECENTVIATGGSVVYCGGAMEHLGKNGVIVYLRLSYDAVARRISNLKGRGVVLKPGQTLEGLYEERTGLYERYAGVTVDCEGLSIEETVEKTLQAVENLLQ